MVRFSRIGLAAVPMCHPSVIRSCQLMRHNGGNALKSQDHCEGLRALPLKSMECGILQRLLENTAPAQHRCSEPLTPLARTRADHGRCPARRTSGADVVLGWCDGPRCALAFPT